MLRQVLGLLLGSRFVQLRHLLLYHSGRRVAGRSRQRTREAGGSGPPRCHFESVTVLSPSHQKVLSRVTESMTYNRGCHLQNISYSISIPYLKYVEMGWHELIQPRPPSHDRRRSTTCPHHSFIHVLGVYLLR